jgi:hypothetical protein
METTSQKVVGDAGKQRRYELSLASLIRCEDYLKLIYFHIRAETEADSGRNQFFAVPAGAGACLSAGQPGPCLSAGCVPYQVHHLVPAPASPGSCLLAGQPGPCLSVGCVAHQVRQVPAGSGLVA